MREQVATVYQGFFDIKNKLEHFDRFRIVLTKITSNILQHLLQQRATSEIEFLDVKMPVDGIHYLFRMDCL